ncbi:MAG: STAS/SEC14 domain-containing protein [Pseudomonadota bacterium]
MLTTPTIREMTTAKPGLHAFRITGLVTREDMAAMGTRMVDVFDENDGKVDMLLIFDGYEGAEPLAGASWPAIKSRTEALWQVGTYVTAMAPDGAAAMVEAMGKVIPPEAHAFDTEAEAWAFFGMTGPAG